MLKDFKEFITRGNAVSMAVGIIIGIAFASIIGLILGGADFSNLFAVLREGAASGPYLSLDAAREAGAVTLNYGIFINAVISFLIIALVLFFIIKAVSRLKKKEEECPFCFSVIDINATRCSYCTSELKE